MTSIDGTMNACGYTKILADKMTPNLQKLGRRKIFQHDNDPKNTAKIMQEKKEKKVKSLTWPSMSPDLNPTEHLWGYFREKGEARQLFQRRAAGITFI